MLYMSQGYSSVFDDNSGGKSFLLKTEKEEQMSVQSSVIRDAIEKGFEVVFIGFQHPYKQLEGKFNLPKHIRDQIWFIDCITREVDGEESEGEKIDFIESPRRLDRVRGKISILTQKIEKDFIILIDSVPAVLAFNDEKKTSEFLRRTIESAETYGARFVLFKESTKLDVLIGKSVYPFIDEFLLLTEDKLNVIKKGKKIYIELIPDVIRATDWEEGEELAYKIKDDKTVQFSEV